MSTCSNLLSVFGGGDWTTTFPFDLVHTRQECDKKREQDYSFFITETCKGENIGIHSYEHTSKIIDTGNNDSTSIEELEVLNIYKAINHFYPWEESLSLKFYEFPVSLFLHPSV